MEARERQVKYYLPHGGKPAPFGLWRDGITDKPTRQAVDARIARLSAGNFSDSKSIGAGASENRIDFGPGYRIYYGVDGDEIVLLLGGDKSSQDSDIEKSKALWRDYKERTNNAKQKLQERSPRRSSKRS